MSVLDRTGQMTQTAPFPQLLADLVSRLSYRPGWQFRLGDIDRDKDGKGNVVGAGLTLDIITRGYNSYQPADGETYRVHHYFIVPAATYDERAWMRWLFERLVDVETHECMEFFKIDARRPFAPSHGPGNNPYSVRDRQTEADAHTMFIGTRTKGTV
jgi:hypothetical protein